MTKSDHSEELLKFPCQFPIKAMGRHDDDFVGIVTGIVQRHAGPLTANQVQTNNSKAGKYLSVTVTITAESKSQLDAIYLDLTAHEAVLVAL